jgi:hypothetical protein
MAGEGQKQQEPYRPQVGDKVGYVVHEAHALKPDAKGDYPWHMGVRRAVNRRGRAEEQVEELEGKELNDYLNFLRRHPNPAEERKRLVFLRPKTSWPTIVTALNDDGSAALDVQSAQGGVTLHEPSVPLDMTRLRPHSFHPTEETVLLRRPKREEAPKQEEASPPEQAEEANAPAREDSR